jgi:hypothetical protein
MVHPPTFLFPITLHTIPPPNAAAQLSGGVSVNNNSERPGPQASIGFMPEFNTIGC